MRSRQITASDMTDWPLLVLGDLCVDAIVAGRLPRRWDEIGVTDEPVFRVPIHERVGGSAFNFARHAAAAGMQPLIVGCVGSDLAGGTVIAALTEAGCHHRIEQIGAAPTARSLIAFDARGARMLMTTERSANDLLSADFVRTRVLPDARPSMVWLSGHCLRDRAAPRWAAVAEAVDQARQAGAQVVLDVVPHDFYQLFPGFDDLQSAIGPIDGITAELDSLRRWLGIDGAGTPPNPKELAGTVSMALDIVPFAILRYHDGTTYRQLAESRTGFRTAETRTVPDSGHLVGYGDLLASVAVRGYLEHLKAQLPYTGRSNR
jgi:hypothetical protein